MAQPQGSCGYVQAMADQRPAYDNNVKKKCRKCGKKSCSCGSKKNGK